MTSSSSAPAGRARECLDMADGHERKTVPTVNVDRFRGRCAVATVNIDRWSKRGAPLSWGRLTSSSASGRRRESASGSPIAHVRRRVDGMVRDAGLTSATLVHPSSTCRFRRRARGRHRVLGWCAIDDEHPSSVDTFTSIRTRQSVTTLCSVITSRSTRSRRSPETSFWMTSRRSERAASSCKAGRSVRRATVGASACVTRDVEAGAVAVGVPARPLVRQITGENDDG